MTTIDTAAPYQIKAILGRAQGQLVANSDDQIVGTCPVCFRAIVLVVSADATGPESAASAPWSSRGPRVAVMVRHGWQEVGRRVGEYGYGQQYGGCDGIGAPAFELSRVATGEHLAGLEAALVKAAEAVASYQGEGPAVLKVLKQRRVNGASVGEMVEYHRGTLHHADELRSCLRKAENYHASIKDQRDYVAKRFAEWAPAEMTTAHSIAKAERDEVEARKAARLADRDAKVAAKAARNAPRLAKLNARLAPVLAAMQAEPERWWTEEEILTLSKTGGQGPLTDSQFSDFTSSYRNKTIETEYRDNPAGWGRSLWARLKSA